MGSHINKIFGMSRVTSKGSAPELVKRETDTRVKCKEFGKSSRIDNEVVQDQRQQDDNNLQDERQDQPKEEEVEHRRSKRARTKKSFGPDFVSFMCTCFPTSDSNIQTTKHVQNVNNQPLRMSERTYVFPNKYNEYVVDLKVKYGLEKFVGYSNLTSENFCFTTELNKDFEPTTYWQACKEQHWIDAMNKEMKALYDNDTWEITDLTKGGKSIGYNQKEGIDFDETFSLVIKLVTVRCLINLAVQNSWPLYQLDANNAFLYGGLSETVYMDLPNGLFSPNDKRLIGKLIYLTHTMPDIAYSVHCLSQFMHKPLKSHTKFALKVLKYLKGSPVDSAGLIRRVKLGSSDITISHLFYVDDVIMTTEWSDSDLDNIILLEEVLMTASNSGCAPGCFLFTYLSLPIGSNMITQVLEVVPFEEQSDDLKKKLAKNNEAKMVLYNALPKKEYERIFMCKTAKDIWQSLLITHQEESIDSGFARFNTIITSLKALDEGFSSKNYVRKFLRALHPKWRAKGPRKFEEFERLSSLAQHELIDAVIQIISLAIFQNNLVTKIKRPSLEVLSDSKNDVEDNTNDETCLMAQSSNEHDNLCEISLKIINKNKTLKTKRDLLEKEVLELNEKIKKLKRNKGINVICESCQELKLENAKPKETQIKFVKFDKSANLLKEMLNNQKSSSCKIGLGFDNSKASTSGTKPMSFVGSPAENATGGSTIKVQGSTIPGSVNRTVAEKVAEYLFSLPMSLRLDFVITRKKLIHNRIDESKKPSLKPSLKSGLGYVKTESRSKTPPPRRNLFSAKIQHTST
ncbi:UBN2 domain-containing protein [Tanacetum coccineum]